MTHEPPKPTVAHMLKPVRSSSYPRIMMNLPSIHRETGVTQDMNTQVEIQVRFTEIEKNKQITFFDKIKQML